VNDWTYPAANWNIAQNGIKVWLFIASDPLSAFRQLCEAQWLLYVMVRLHINSSCVLPMQCVYFFLVGGWTNSSCFPILLFLGAFVRLREATVSFVMSVRPSARNNSAPAGRIFMTLRIFRKSVDKIQVSFKIWHLEASWNVMSHAQETSFRLSAKRASPFKSAKGRQFSRLLAAELCASAVVILVTPCSEVVWRVLATHCIRQFPIHFSSRASPCAITFQLDYHKFESPPSWPVKMWWHTRRNLISSFSETDKSI